MVQVAGAARGAAVLAAGVVGLARQAADKPGTAALTATDVLVAERAVEQAGFGGAVASLRTTSGASAPQTVPLCSLPVGPPGGRRACCRPHPAPTKVAFYLAPSVRAVVLPLENGSARIFCLRFSPCLSLPLPWPRCRAPVAAGASHYWRQSAAGWACWWRRTKLMTAFVSSGRAARGGQGAAGRGRPGSPSAVG